MNSFTYFGRFFEGTKNTKYDEHTNDDGGEELHGKKR